MEQEIEQVIQFFLDNPWASFIGLIVSGISLRYCRLKGYGK